MKSQDGYHSAVQQVAGSFSRWVTDYKTGEKKRQQRAFVIGSVKQFTKIKARDALREHMVSELGLTAEPRMPNMPGYSICCSPNFLGPSPKNLSRFD